MSNISLRSIARIQAMKILYIADMNDISVENALVMAKTGILDQDGLNENKEIEKETEEFLNFVVLNLDDIDNCIKNTLVNYTIDRLNAVDKAIIRVATAELIEGKLDKKIIINEALEITKLYSDNGTHKAVAFNNRLLDNISLSLKK
ncbi:MAG: transcription antitermination protein NusB [Acholeplasmatales bacterium]|nr:transcription antitermination protein NusB [Acholeplasmatales bacterium]